MPPEKDDIIDCCEDEDAYGWNMCEYLIKRCPNKRVIHLIKFGRTARIRKKNINRAARITPLY